MSSYSIRPLDMMRVFSATRGELEGLLGHLAGARPPLDEAAQGLRGSPAILAELAVFGDEHDGLAREIGARVDAALHHGQQAVDGYVRGDELMAEQHGRAAGAFSSGTRLQPDLSDSPNPRYNPPPVLGPPPVLVEGD